MNIIKTKTEARTSGTDVSNIGDNSVMTVKTTDGTEIVLRCGCEPNSFECLRNNTLLNPNGTYRCKLLRYQHNQLRQVP